VFRIPETVKNPRVDPQGDNASDWGFGVRMNSWSGCNDRAYGWVLRIYKPPSVDQGAGVVAARGAL
jgi:hypothetical protein